MERVIKFRAWNGSSMIYESLQKEYDDYYMLNLQGEFFAHTRTGDEDFRMYDSQLNHLTYKIMQYTGLKDKNGVEIYDVDIITWTNGTVRKDLEMVPNVQVITVSIDAVSYCNISQFGMVQNSLEVIGNIYEHAHLLTP